MARSQRQLWLPSCCAEPPVCVHKQGAIRAEALVVADEKTKAPYSTLYFLLGKNSTRPIAWISAPVAQSWLRVTPGAHRDSGAKREELWTCVELCERAGTRSYAPTGRCSCRNAGAHVPRHLLGGSARESNSPEPFLTAHIGFEDRGQHQPPRASTSALSQQHLASERRSKLVAGSGM